MFLKNLSVDATIEDLPAPTRGKWEATLKFQMRKYISLHISETVFLR